MQGCPLKVRSMQSRSQCAAISADDDRDQSGADRVQGVKVREMKDDTKDDRKQPRRIDSLKRWKDETVLTGILIGVVAMVLFDLIVASIRHMP
jgi:hypothetical protein